MPPFPAEFVGAVGATLQVATFDFSVGPEVFLCLFEPEHSSPLEPWPTKFEVKSGIAHTQHGPLLFFLWSIVKGERRLAWYEHLVNPLHRQSSVLIEEAAVQEFFKVVAIDSKSGSVLNLVEFENIYFEGTLLDAVRDLRPFTGADFQAAVRDFQRDYSPETLLGEIP